MRANKEINSCKVKGLVLAGGRGKRLDPLTNCTSKHLLPVSNKALILYPIKALLKAGVKDILVLIDHRHASQYMELLKDGSHLGVRSLAYVWQSQEGKGLPSAIAQIEPFIDDEKIIVICGDMIIKNGINEPVADFIKQKAGARLCVTEVNDTAGYSPIFTSENLITQIIPKDQNRHTSGLIDLGVYMFHQDVFKRVKNLTPSSRGETEIWDLNTSYISENQLFFTSINGWWSDVGGSIETYLKANEYISKNLSFF